MRILLFILSLFFCVIIDAQKLTVESFAENTRDLAARTEQRVDNNGVPCALVKVCNGYGSDRDYGRSVRPVCP